MIESAVETVEKMLCAFVNPNNQSCVVLLHEGTPPCWGGHVRFCILIIGARTWLARGMQSPIEYRMPPSYRVPLHIADAVNRGRASQPWCST